MVGGWWLGSRNFEALLRSKHHQDNHLPTTNRFTQSGLCAQKKASMNGRHITNGDSHLKFSEKIGANGSIKLGCRCNGQENLHVQKHWGRSMLAEICWQNLLAEFSLKARGHFERNLFNKGISSCCSRTSKNSVAMPPDSGREKRSLRLKLR